jgi:chromosome partitioning protein
MAMVILIGGEKGGTGKSTLTINLAVMHSLKKKDVLIVDADKQGTTSLWASARDENGITPRISCVQKFGKNIHTEVAALSEKYETIFIDAGGRDSVELRASLLVADIFLTPIRASQSDAWTLDHLESLILDAKLINPDLKSLIVVNQAPTNPSISEVAEINDFLSEFESFNEAKSIVRDRIIFRHSFKESLGCIEYKPADKKAIAELNGLYKEVFK